MGRSMLSKSLIQISVDGRACVPSLLFDLRPNYGGHNEDDGDLLQKVPCKQCSRPPQVHAPTRDSWRAQKVLVCMRSQVKGVVTPQEREPDLPVSVQESPAEVWVNSGLPWGQKH